jgi:hypothetical protein
MRHVAQIRSVVASKMYVRFTRMVAERLRRDQWEVMVWEREAVTPRLMPHSYNTISITIHLHVS